MRSLPDAQRVAFALAIAIGALACSEPTVSMTVELRTDVIPGVEFLAVETTVEGSATPRESSALRTDDFNSAPRRVAEFTGLTPSSARRVTVRLLDNERREVVRYSLVVDHRVDRSVLMLVGRRCGGVRCGAGETCFAETCQPDTCEGAECVPQCSSAADCTVAACARASCVTGACFAEIPGDSCDVGAYCNPDLGCLPDPTTGSDAGMLEDAGPAPDAGVDAGVDGGMDGGVDGGRDGGVDGGPPPAFTLWSLADGAVVWAEASTTGAAPTIPVRAAFSAAAGSELIALTDTSVHVLQLPARRWVERYDRDALFPELAGVSIWEATDISGTNILSVYGAAGVWEYSWTSAARTARFAAFTARRDFGAAWDDTDAAPYFAVHGIFSHPDNASGWVSIDPSAECPGHTSVGRYLGLVSTDGFGPLQMVVSVFDIECPFRFVEQRRYSSFPPFARTGAPAPFSLEAVVYRDGELLAFTSP